MIEEEIQKDELDEEKTPEDMTWEFLTKYQDAEEARIKWDAREEDLRENLPRYLIAIRKYLHLKQEELAEILGVDASYISKIENGHTDPTFNWIERLGEYVTEHIND